MPVYPGALRVADHSLGKGLQVHGLRTIVERDREMREYRIAEITGLETRGEGACVPRSQEYTDAAYVHASDLKTLCLRRAKFNAAAHGTALYLRRIPINRSKPIRLGPVLEHNQIGVIPGIHSEPARVTIQRCLYQRHVIGKAK